MNMTDPIADMLTRIRNASRVRHASVPMPLSKMKVAIARILRQEGYIKEYEVSRDTPEGTLRIWLKYGSDKQPVITNLRRVSKPGLRVYTGREGIPRVKGGLGIAIMSTPQGVMTGLEAYRAKVGGEVLAYVW